MAEKDADVPEGQGNPPEVVTDTLALLNEASEFVLLHVPLISTVPDCAEQFWPRTLAVHLKVPPFSSEPVGVAHKVQLPLAVQVVLMPRPLIVHPVRVGALTASQTGVPGEEEVVGVVPLTHDVLHVTVVVPSFMVTVVPEHKQAVKLVPPGETVSANTM